jgi:two-component system LytT family response regulator
MKTLIAEDEPLAREGLADWVRETPGLELVAAVSDGDSALQRIRELRPELVLMDIQMPGLTGLQVLRALADDGGNGPAVIFTTAYDEHALSAFELHAVDYLLKPFSRERFAEAVAYVQQRQGVSTDSALQALQQATPGNEPLRRLLVRDMGRIVPLQVEAIDYLRADTKYTAIVSQGRTYLVRLAISDFARRLDPTRFLKVNRSCIVNLDQVEAMTPDDSSQFVVQLKDGSRFTASREVSKQLRADSL